METEKQDIYQRVTTQIIEAVEAGVRGCRMPWHVTAESSLMPLNAASKRFYRGINVLVLWASAAVKSYPSNVWATYKQWQELGAQVREKEKSTTVVLWKFPEREQLDEEQDEETGRKQGRGILARGYSVFNAAQVDGYQPPAIEPLDDALRNAAADRFFATLHAEIQFGGAAAYYDPVGDFIQMPEYRLFRDVSGFYGTLAHEMTHWSGAPQRLNRDLTPRFGSAGYAVEELVAELGAAFLCATLGMSSEPRPDHASYIQSWLGALRNDKRAIFTAASKAQAAVDWMHAQQGAQAQADAPAKAA